MDNNFADKASQIPEKEWIELSVELPEHLQDAVANFLMEQGVQGVVTDEEIAEPRAAASPVDRGRYKRLSAYLQNSLQTRLTITALERYLRSLASLHQLAHVPLITLRAIREQDWNTQWQQFFSICRIGRRIIIKPSWETYLPQAQDTVIELDPGMAFGTGTHPTTRMCLEVMENLIAHQTLPIHAMLDVGTGSGILCIAAAKLGVKKVVGIDIDPVALRCARLNAEKNQVAHQVEVRECLLDRVPERFDLIVANILSEILIKLRKDLIKHLAGNGILVLSGILAEKGPELMQRFASKRLLPVDSRNQGEWTCIVLQKQLTSP